jgi:7,8-didemethyl-8-hydroxy-5-deazariboflavin synthase CofG subunit
MVLAGYPAGRVGRGQEQYALRFTKGKKMVVGYALGNRNDQESDILVLNEDSPNVVTYSHALYLQLSKMCLPHCQTCLFQRKDTIIVPYSTIRLTKQARLQGLREVLYYANPRPDQYSQIRSLLELWGFDTYADYLYTVCELGFLEGLIPVIDLGFLTPQELRQLSEVAALVKISFENSFDKTHEDMYGWSSVQRYERRIKNFEWASKLKIPIIANMVVYKGGEKSRYKEWLQYLAALHKQYEMIHEVSFEAFSGPVKAASKRAKEVTEISVMLEMYELAKSILPADIPVILPFTPKDLPTLLKAGVRDLGRILNTSFTSYGQEPYDLQELHQTVESLGFTAQQRFPLRKEFIKNEKYSKKLGQVFDTYRYKIKKDVQERQKEAKS